MNGRSGCFFIPSERIVALAWCRAHEPTGWRALWLKLAKAWR
jgi:hypothetical protein